MVVAFAFFHRPPTKLREGNVFTGVCKSFCPRGLGVGMPGTVLVTPWKEYPQKVHPSGGTPPEGTQDTSY